MIKVGGLLSVVVLAWLYAGSVSLAADAPRLGETTEVEFTPSLPTRGPGLMYQFILRYNQGERFRFEVNPVGGADLKTEILLDLPDRTGSKPGATFDGTGTHPSHDWTMTKPAPGNFLYVKLVGYALGKVRLRVTKVGGNEELNNKNDSAELRALVEKLQRRITELEAELNRRDTPTKPR